MAQPDPNVLTFDVVGTLIDFEAGMLEPAHARPGSQLPSLAALAGAVDAIRVVPAGMAAA